MKLLRHRYNFYHRFLGKWTDTGGDASGASADGVAVDAGGDGDAVDDGGGSGG